MAIYLEHVENAFDRQQLRYIELVDAFGVGGVHARLQELRQAHDNNESASVLAAKRRFLEMDDEWKPRVLVKQAAILIDCLEFELSVFPVGTGNKFLLLDQN